MTDFDEFRLWKKDRPQEYLRIRGRPTAGNKDELISLAFGKTTICDMYPIHGINRRFGY